MAAIALLLLVNPAGAAPPKEAGQDRVATLLKLGADSAKAKKWDACIEALTAAAEIDGSPRTWGELGLCEENAGRFALAYRHLSRARDGSPPDQRGKDPWAQYLSALRRVTERIAVVLITTDPPSAPVVLDARPMGPADGNEIALEPGRHTFAARLAGHEDAVFTRDVDAGTTPHVHLLLKPKPRAASTAPLVPVAPSVAEPLSTKPWYLPAWGLRGGLLMLTYASAATSLAAAATWVGFEFARADLRAGLPDDYCHPAQASIPDRCLALHERYEQRLTAMYVTISGLVATAVLGGATGLAFRLDRSPLRPSIAPTVTQHGGGFVLLGAW